MMKVVPADIGKKVRFELSAKPGTMVFVAGTFNNWSPVANRMKDAADTGRFKATVRVPTGAHEYRLIVDGVWTTDPKCAGTVPNAFGSMNSVVHV